MAMRRSGSCCSRIHGLERGLSTLDMWSREAVVVHDDVVAGSNSSSFDDGIRMMRLEWLSAAGRMDREDACRVAGAVLLTRVMAREDAFRVWSSSGLMPPEVA